MEIGEISGILVAILGSGTIGAALMKLVDKLRNKDQKNTDEANAFEKMMAVQTESIQNFMLVQEQAMDSFMKSQTLITESYRKNEEEHIRKYADLEKKYDDLDTRFIELKKENKDFKRMVSAATGCKLLTNTPNGKCPVLEINKSRTPEHT